MTLVARELDLDPKRYPAAPRRQVSNLKNELIDDEAYVPGQTAGPDAVPRPTRSTSSGCARRTPWTSTT